MERILLKKVIDDLYNKNLIPIKYPGFIQAMKNKNIPEPINELIIKIKKISNVSYYVKDSDLEKFKELISSLF